MARGAQRDDRAEHRSDERRKAQLHPLKLQGPHPTTYRSAGNAARDRPPATLSVGKARIVEPRSSRDDGGRRQRRSLHRSEVNDPDAGSIKPSCDQEGRAGRQRPPAGRCGLPRSSLRLSVESRRDRAVCARGGDVRQKSGASRHQPKVKSLAANFSLRLGPCDGDYILDKAGLPEPEGRGQASPSPITASMLAAGLAAYREWEERISDEMGSSLVFDRQAKELVESIFLKMVSASRNDAETP